MYYSRFTLLSCAFPLLTILLDVFTYNPDFSNNVKGVYLCSIIQAVLFINLVWIMPREWCIPHHNEGWKSFFCINVLTLIFNVLNMLRIDISQYTDVFVCILVLPLYTFVMTIIFAYLRVFKSDHLTEIEV